MLMYDEYFLRLSRFCVRESIYFYLDVQKKDTTGMVFNVVSYLNSSTTDMLIIFAKWRCILYSNEEYYEELFDERCGVHEHRVKIETKLLFEDLFVVSE